MGKINKQAVLFLLAVFCSSSVAFAQTKAKDSVIKLKEVVINSRDVKTKTVKVKTEGKDSGYLTLSSHFQYVSLVNKIPEGYLSSLKVYFNSRLMYLFKEKMGLDYQDIKAGLVIYEVGKDGKPGNKISDKELQFTVTKDHRGALELNLRPLNLKSENRMYIGFEILSDTNGNNILLKMKKRNDAVTYINNGDSEWGLYSNSPEYKLNIKLTLKIEVPR